MAFGVRHSRALVLGASAFSFALMSSGAAFTQALEGETVTRTAEQKKQKQAKREQAKPQQDEQAPAPVMNAMAQIGAAPVQSLDTITAVATKTEERAIDALAPVSVVTLEQIQGRQASTLGGLLYNIPGVWVQDRGDEPSTSINIRGLQDFGRVAVVVDGARQNYQRTGHFANGSFFLNPELVSSIDIVRGPTANIYGSGAIGGVASFRTKDIDDVVRAGERWGVDAKTIFGTNQGRALGSVFGGVRVNPNVDVFAGGIYSTQESYKDGTGFEVANTGNRLSAGIAKVTVRPADGHEVKLGTIFQEDLYNVGQPARRAGDPNTTNANGTNNLNGTSIYQFRREELHDDARLEIFTAGRQVCSIGMRRSTGIVPRTIRSRRATPARLPQPFAAACRAMRSPAVLVTTGVICSIRSVSTYTTPRASSMRIGGTRSPTEPMRSRTT